MNKGRKISGGKYHANRKSRLYERRGQERTVVLGAVKSKVMRHRGGRKDFIMLASNQVNLTSDKKTQKTTITNVLETPQNKFLARQNRIMKGAIVETPLGKARITNRPTREGCINAILIKA